MKSASTFTKSLLCAVLVVCMSSFSNVALAQTSFVVPGFLGDITFEDGFIYMTTMSGDRRIQKIDPSTRVVVSHFFASVTPGLNVPRGIAGNGEERLFITDVGSVVHEITTSGTSIRSFALPDPVPLGEPGFRGGALAFDGTNLFVGDSDASTILVIERATGTLVRHFSSGRRPEAMVFDPTTGNLWLLDTFVANTMFEMSPTGAALQACDVPFSPGTNPPPGTPQGFGLAGLALIGSDFYIADSVDPTAPGEGTRISTVSRDSLVCTSLEGEATISTLASGLTTPYHMAVHGQFLYVADPGVHQVVRINKETGEKTVVAGVGGEETWNGDGLPALSTALNNPSGVAVDPVTGALFVADTGNDVIRKVDQPGAANATMVIVAGIPRSPGVAVNSSPDCLEAGPTTDLTPCLAKNLPMAGPRGMTFHNGNLYFADNMNQVVRRLQPIPPTLGTGFFVFHVAGVAGFPGGNDDLDCPESCPLARFNSPYDVAADAAGNIYVADDGNNQIRVILPSGRVSSVLNDGATLGLSRPRGLAVVAPRGNLRLFVADSGHHRIYRLECGDGCSDGTLAGELGEFGNSGDSTMPADQALLNTPHAVVLDGDLLHVADTKNGKIRTINLEP